VIASELGLSNSVRLFTRASYDNQDRCLAEMIAPGYGSGDIELYWNRMQRHGYQAWDPLY
jgi:hypothetical protein